eukprot:TRINITY_DN10556_c0_g1_i1.p1 TRINITY_DN10556_c0_g1~~TRINITY_DN10556_c0_g1_i1.p1  ORF type:complete len:788 (+),score=231.60 TRINITY_DN10556_c0_g1_i1:112-2475(+)
MFGFGKTTKETKPLTGSAPPSSSAAAATPVASAPLHASGSVAKPPSVLPKPPLTDPRHGFDAGRDLLFDSPIVADNEAPLLLVKLLRFLQAKEIQGSRAEGIFGPFRGNQLEVHDLKAKIRYERNNVQLMNYTRNALVVAELLKQYLGSMPQPLLTYEAYDSFLLVQTTLRSKDERYAQFRRLVTDLPRGYRSSVNELLRFLHEVHILRSDNSMPASRLAQEFAATLLRPAERTHYMLDDDLAARKAARTLIKHYPTVFVQANSAHKATQRASLSAPRGDLFAAELAGPSFLSGSGFVITPSASPSASSMTLPASAPSTQPGTPVLHKISSSPTPVPTITLRSATPEGPRPPTEPIPIAAPATVAAEEDEFGSFKRSSFKLDPEFEAAGPGSQLGMGMGVLASAKVLGLEAYAGSIEPVSGNGTRDALLCDSADPPTSAAASASAGAERSLSTEQGASFHSGSILDSTTDVNLSAVSRSVFEPVVGKLLAETGPDGDRQLSSLLDSVLESQALASLGAQDKAVAERLASDACDDDLEPLDAPSFDHPEPTMANASPASDVAAPESALDFRHTPPPANEAEAAPSLDSHAEPQAASLAEHVEPEALSLPVQHEAEASLPARAPEAALSTEPAREASPAQQPELAAQDEPPGHGSPEAASPTQAEPEASLPTHAGPEAAQHEPAAATESDDESEPWPPAQAEFEALPVQHEPTPLEPESGVSLVHDEAAVSPAADTAETDDDVSTSAVSEPTNFNADSIILGADSLNDTSELENVDRQPLFDDRFEDVA